ncbi:MAG: TRAP transporter substrate-binding protein [Eubacteriales bacterium]|nr:TRAP transporter substrate-binding protein [Eubacteriales bacterium]
MKRIAKTAFVSIMLIACIAFVYNYDKKDIQNEVSSIQPEEIFTMQIGHGHGVGSIRHRVLRVFKSMVEERTDGGVIVNIFPSGQLGTELDMHKEVEEGTLQGVWGGGFDIVPKLSIFTLPFLADDETEMYRLLESDFMMDICKESQSKGIEVLGIGCGGGFRQLSNNVRPIKSPDDMKGLRIRVNDIETIRDTMEAFGAELVNIPYNDIYQSLKQGIADGQENPWSNIVSMRFYEVQKYFTKIDYQFHPNPFYVNSKWLNSLPPEYEKIIRECAKTMISLERQYEEKEKENDLKQIMAYSEIYELTEEERNEFKKASEIVYEKYLDEGIVTKEELEIIERIKKGEAESDL